MSSTLQVLTTSLETEKIQHLKLLKDFNQHLIDLISQIELSELITIVNQSH